MEIREGAKKCRYRNVKCKTCSADFATVDVKAQGNHTEHFRAELVGFLRWENERIVIVDTRFSLLVDLNLNLDYFE